MKDRLILEFPNAIPAEKVKWIQDMMKKSESFASPNAGNREGLTIPISHYTKDSYELKLVDEYLFKVFGKIVDDISSIYNPPYQTDDSGYEYHMYEPGQICTEHIDGEVRLGKTVYGSFKESTVRYATVVIYLTDNENGGELVFPDSDVAVKPEAGKAVVFPPTGAYRHYSNPSKEQREIVMTWLTYSGIVAFKEGA